MLRVSFSKSASFRQDCNSATFSMIHLAKTNWTRSPPDLRRGHHASLSFLLLFSPLQPSPESCEHDVGVNDPRGPRTVYNANKQEHNPFLSTVIHTSESPPTQGGNPPPTPRHSTLRLNVNRTWVANELKKKEKFTSSVTIFADRIVNFQ